MYLCIGVVQNHLNVWNIWPMKMTLIGTTQSLSGPGSNGNEGVTQHSSNTDIKEISINKYEVLKKSRKKGKNQNRNDKRKESDD